MNDIHTVLLTGATGFIGSSLDSRLRQAGYSVVPAARSLGLDFNRMRSPDDWMPHLRGVDAVVNAVGIIAQTQRQRFEVLHRQAPMALFSACAATGVRRVVQISALGADEHAFTPYQLSKRAADDHLRSLSLGWFVLRPSLVFGEGSRSLRFFRALARMPLLLLPDGGTQPVQPVHIDDLSECVLHCLRSERTNLTLDLVGPRPFRFVDWLALLRRQQGRQGDLRVCDIPPSLFMTAAHLVRHALPLAHPDNLRMLQQGNMADARPLAQFLGRPLRDMGDPA